MCNENPDWLEPAAPAQPLVPAQPTHPDVTTALEATQERIKKGWAAAPANPKSDGDYIHYP